MSFWTGLKENSTALGTTAVAIGGLLYVLLTLVARWVYEPLGVKPAEVGLGYGPLLVGTAVALPSVLIIAVIYTGIALAVSWIAAKLAGKLGRVWFVLILLVVGAVAVVEALPDVALTVYASAVVVAAAIGALWGASRKTRVILSLVVVVVTVGVGVIAQADQARNDLMRGHSYGFGIFTTPWDAAVVRVHWTLSDVRGPRLPPCLLFLGEANGTSVFFDPGAPLDDSFPHDSFEDAFDPRQARALRLPTSSVAIEVLPNQAYVTGYPPGLDARDRKAFRESASEDYPCFRV